MGAHVGMLGPKGHVDIEAGTDVIDALGQRRRDDRDVVEAEHGVWRKDTNRKGADRKRKRATCNEQEAQV